MLGQNFEVHQVMTRRGEPGSALQRGLAPVLRDAIEHSTVDTGVFVHPEPGSPMATGHGGCVSQEKLAAAVPLLEQVEEHGNGTLLGGIGTGAAEAAAETSASSTGSSGSSSSSQGSTSPEGPSGPGASQEGSVGLSNKLGSR